MLWPGRRPGPGLFNFDRAVGPAGCRAGRQLCGRRDRGRDGAAPVAEARKYGPDQLGEDRCWEARTVDRRSHRCAAGGAFRPCIPRSPKFAFAASTPETAPVMVDNQKDLRAYSGEPFMHEPTQRSCWRRRRSGRSVCDASPKRRELIVNRLTVLSSETTALTSSGPSIRRPRGCLLVPASAGFCSQHRPSLSKLEALDDLIEHWAMAPERLHPDAAHIC